MGKRIVLADPRGFCAGVDRAILTVRTILKSADTPRADGLPPVYVRRQIVHNKHVVEDLAAQGAVFVQELAEIPDAAAEAGIPIVFSAHGVSPAVKAEAAARGMHVVDATCPLVSKVHREVLRFVKEGYEIIYIGHKGHDEAVGVVEEAPEHVHLIEHASDVDSLDFQPDTKLVLLTQTTLSVDETAGTITALKARFPWRNAAELRHLLCHVESSGGGQARCRASRLRGDCRLREFLEFRAVDGSRSGGT